jgi:sugar phosphate isomerase/epimerase
MINLASATVSCDGFEDSGFRESFYWLPKIGYKHVEFNCWHPSNLTPNAIRSMKRQCIEAGLTPAGLYGPYFGGGSREEIAKDVCAKIRLIDAAVELGCSRVVATGTARGKLGGLDAIIAALHEVTPYAEERGILIGLENHANNNLETIEDYERLFAEISSPNVGLCIDTGHFEASGIALDDVVSRLGHKVNHLHVKDNAQFGVQRFVKFGEGTTDNVKLVEQMVELRYSGYVTVEYSVPDKSDLMRDLKVPYDMFARFEI